MGAATGMGANPSGAAFGAAAMFGGGGRGGGLPPGGGGIGGGSAPLGLPPRGGSSAAGGGGGGGWQNFLNSIGYGGVGSLKGAGQFALNAGAIGAGVMNVGASALTGSGALERQEVFGGLEATIRAQSGRDKMFSMLHSNASGYGNILAQKGVAYNNGLKADANGMLIDAKAGPLNTAGAGGGFMSEAYDRSESIANKNLAGSKLGGYASTAGGVVNALGAGKSLGGLTGGFSVAAGASAAGGALFDGVIDAKLKTMKINQGEQDAMRGEMQAYGFQLLEQLGGPALAAASGAQQGTAGVRLAASRAMGGGQRSGALMGQGARFGFDLGESTALGAGIAGQFGARTANLAAPQAMQLANKGFDASTAGGVIGQMAQAGSSGQKALTQIMRDGVKQGMTELDVKFFEKIGVAVAEASVGAGGANASVALGGVLMSGLGATPNMRDVQGNISGMHLADQQQRSGFMASRRLVDAANILGPGAAGEEMEGLGDASIADLVAQANKGKHKGEEGNEALNIQGVTSKQAQSQLDQIVGRTGSILSGGNSAPAKRLSAAVEKYGGFQQALASKDKSIIADAAWLGQRRLGGADLDSFKGEMRAFGGLSEKEMGKFFGGGAVTKDVSDRGALGEKNKQTGQILADVAHYGTLLAEAQKQALAKLKSSLEAMKDMRGTEGLSSAREVNQSLKGMGESVNLVTDIIVEAAQKISKSMGIDITKIQAKATRQANEKKNSAHERDSTPPPFGFGNGPRP